MIKKKKNKKKPSTKKTTTTTTTTKTIVTTTEVDKNLDTHYLLVLDRSGSMDSCWDSTIEGLNEQLGTIRGLEEKYPEQRYFITLVAFDAEIETIIEDAPISEVENFDGTEFPPRGMTSLHDAMGISISNLKNTLKKKENNSDSVSTALVVIMTDGGENNSKEYRGQEGMGKIKKMIDDLEETGLWTFSFMGANQDAVLTAKGFGIAKGNSITYSSTNKGATRAYATLNSAISNMAYMNTSTWSMGASAESMRTVDKKNFMSSVVDGDTLGEDESNVKKTKESKK